MAVHIALIRGINVGGHKPVAMADLCAMLAALGFTSPRSLLQSGNLVFGVSRRPCAAVERLLEGEALKRLALEATFVVRTGDEWRRVIAGNPFTEEARRDPAHLTVTFLKEAPGERRAAALQAAVTGPEVLRVDGAHAYIYYPTGIGRSRLTGALIEKTLGTRGTSRNWNTILKLARVAGG